MRTLSLLPILLSCMAWGQQFHKDSLQPGESMTISVSILAPSRTLSKQEMAAIRQRPMRPATREECDPFPCRMGAFVTFLCPKGYALLNQFQGIIASSIPDGDATMEDVWDETPRPLHKCQNVADFKEILSLKRGLADGVSQPIPQALKGSKD